MAVVLTADQIPQFWEAIKFACVNADEIDEKFLPKYLNRLLYQLLSSKAQCHVRLDEGRQLQALAVTKLLTDNITDEKTLFISCVYSFIKTDPSIWLSDMIGLSSFAKKNNCKSITISTNIDELASLLESTGLRHRYKSYILNI